MPLGGLWLGSWARFIIGNRLAPYVPSPTHIGQRMLKLANLQREPSEHVVDLGCGDGRLLIRAAEVYGATGEGYELNRALAKTARGLIAAKGITDLITIHNVDAKSADLKRATAVMLYLSERGNGELLPLLRAQLRTGARVVSFSFVIPGLAATKTEVVDGIGLYLYSDCWGDKLLK